ncbi:hypothetical protein BV25DRAFT_1835609 [Artomyces pyxidatus]|uniref:Uncharacterized protein n=1 Tax=Artomyces pyxidatus TaxID=48021 RepID=A0ACB8TDU7_9AGAM|nr:hypothetical protein BV25DRAFT_1835609 [Artomyces pyxidatus]
MAQSPLGELTPLGGRQPEEKKDTQKKKTPTKKKAETGVWPCKMNGCNKEFAREADLKRHQRTTKLHSMPGFACPQCEATFTRPFQTDALRRHQKSRHNGVIIEPTENERPKGMSQAGDEEPVSGGSKSRSRSGTPGSKKAQTAPPAPLAHPHPGGPIPVFVPPRTPGGVVVDPNYPGLPTSAARMHPGWIPAPPWATEGHPLPYPPSYYPYYTHPGMLPPPHMVGPPPPMPSGTPAGPHPPPPPPPAGQQPGGVDPQPSQDGDTEMRDETTKSEANNDAAAESPKAPVIDPSLDAGTSQTPAQKEQPVSMEITSAAMQAVFHATRAEVEQMYAQETARNAASDEDKASESSKEPTPVEHQDTDDEVKVKGDANDEGRKESGQSDPTAGERPPGSPMQHILTEDGPMLNPAELLTQVCLQLLARAAAAD